MRVFLFLSLIFLFSCNKTLTSKEEKLNTVAITLEKNEDVILTGINSAVFSNDGKYIYICDTKLNRIVKYDANTGNICNSASPGLELADSVLAHFPQAFSDEDSGNLCRYVSLEEIKRTDPKLSIGRYLKHFFDKIKIYEGTIYVAATLYTPTIVLNSQDKIISNQAAILKYSNNLELLSCTPLECIDESHSMSYDFAVVDDGFITTCINNSRITREGRYDSLAILASYSKNGKFKSVVEYLPEIYTSSKLGYSSSQNVQMISTDKDICFVYPTYPYLNFLESKESIPMNEVSKKNNWGFENYNEEMLLDFNKYKKAFPVFVNNIFTDNKYLYVRLIVMKLKDEENIRTGLLQKYDSEGRFVESIDLGDYNKNKIKYIGFAKHKNCFFVIKMDKKTGWSMEFIDFFSEGK